MRNRYLHEEEEDKSSLTDRILIGIALLGLGCMGAKCMGAFDPAKPKLDSRAVPSDNMIYMDNNGDGDLDSLARSKSGVLFELKYDDNGNPYIEHKSVGFDVNPDEPYSRQKERALSARSR